MPAYVLTPLELGIVGGLVGRAAAAHSPLHAIVPMRPARTQSAEDARRSLEERHLVERAGDSWRVNHLFGSVLLTCLEPDEVLALQTFGATWPGFATCRKGPLVTECTVAADGSVKFAFPISKSAVQLSVAAALSSDRPEPEPTGFRFRGSAGAAFVLSVLLHAEREGRPRLDRDGLAVAVRAAIGDPTRTLGLALVAGGAELVGLADLGALDEAVAELAASGMVVGDGGAIRPSEIAMTALAGAAIASFMISRTAAIDGRIRRSTLHATRVGARIITFRVSDVVDRREVEWMEVSRRRLRTLVHAVTMDERELAAYAATTG